MPPSTVRGVGTKICRIWAAAVCPARVSISPIKKPASSIPMKYIQISWPFCRSFAISSMQTIIAAPSKREAKILFGIPPDGALGSKVVNVRLPMDIAIENKYIRSR